MPWSSGIYSRNSRMVQYLQINQCDAPHLQNKGENHTVISIDKEKALGKIQHPVMIKNSQQSEYRGNVPQHNKGHIQ